MVPDGAISSRLVTNNLRRDTAEAWVLLLDRSSLPRSSDTEQAMPENKKEHLDRKTMILRIAVGVALVIVPLLVILVMMSL